jgi:hypothetical protein
MPKHGPRLAQAHDGLVAEPVQPVAEADGGGRLALAGRGRGDGGDQHQLAVGAVRQGVDGGQVDLGLGMTVGNEIVEGEPQLLADLRDRLHLRRAGNLDVALHLCHGRTSLLPNLICADREGVGHLPGFCQRGVSADAGRA